MRTKRAFLVDAVRELRAGPGSVEFTPNRLKG